MLGLLALWFGIFAPFAVFSAVRSLRRIRASNGSLSGTASAMTGLIAGSLALAVILAGVAWWIFAA